jgi:hypothetical protein
MGGFEKYLQPGYEEEPPASVGGKPVVQPGTPESDKSIREALAKDRQEKWETAIDTGRAAANTATFGGYDRAAALGNVALGYDKDYATALPKQFAATDTARQRTPWGSFVGDLAGSAVTPSFGGPRLAAALGNSALARFTGHGLSGGIQGGLQGAGATRTGDWRDVLENAAPGAVLGFGTSGLYGSLFGPRGMVRGGEMPGSGANFGDANTNYNRLRANQTIYSPSEVSALGARTRAQLNPDSGLEPTSTRVLNNIQGGRTGTNILTPADLETEIQRLNKISPVTHAADLSTAGKIKKAINDFYINPPPGAIHSSSPPGAAADAAEAALRARASHAVGERQLTFEKILEKGAQEASMPGAKAEPRIVQSLVKNTLTNPLVKSNPLRGYNAEEQAAINAITKAPLANTLGGVGKSMGGDFHYALPFVSAGAGTAAAGGATLLGADPTTAGLFGSTVPVVGKGFSMAGNRSLANTINRAENVIGRRAPLYMERAATAPLVPGPAPVPFMNSNTIRNFMTNELVRQQQRARQPLQSTVRPEDAGGE